MEKSFIEEVDKVLFDKDSRSDVKSAINGFGKIWKTGIQDSQGSDIPKILNYLFYTDGKPDPDSVGKLTKLLKEFVFVAQMMKMLDKENILTNYLTAKGINVTISETLQNYDNNNNKFLRLFNDSFSGPSPETAKELVKKLVEAGLRQMEDFDTFSEQIKDKVEKIHLKHNLEKPAIETAIQVSDKKAKGKDYSDFVRKINKKNQDINEVINEVT